MEYIDVPGVVRKKMNDIEITDIKDNLLDKLSLASIAMLSINIFNLIFVFILHIILARCLGSEDYGVYYFIVTLITVLSIFTKAGGDTLPIRYIPKYVSENDFGSVKGLLLYTSKRTAYNCFFVIVISILVIIILNNYKHINVEYYYGLLLLPFLSFLHITQAKLAGFKLVIKSQITERVMFPLFFVLSILIFSNLYGVMLTAKETLVLHLLGIVFSFIFVKYMLFKHIKVKYRSIKENYNKKIWKVSCYSFIFITASFMILNQIDILMVGILLDKEHSGIYGIAARVAILTAYGLHATNLVLAPYVSKLYTEKKITNLKKLLQTAAKYNLLLSIIIASLILLFSTEILSLFGNKFIEGKFVLLLLCIGQLINVMAGSTGVLMNMSGNEYPASKIMLITVVLNIILNATFIPWLGMEGAALATAITTAFWNIAMLTYSCKYIGINTSVLGFPFKV